MNKELVIFTIYYLAICYLLCPRKPTDFFMLSLGGLWFWLLVTSPQGAYIMVGVVIALRIAYKVINGLAK